MKRTLFGAALLAFALAALAAQARAAPATGAVNPSATAPSAAAPAADAQAQPGDSSQPLAGPKAASRSFRGVELGMDRDAAIAALKKDPIFAYRGPEDISLLPSPNQSLIDVAGLSFVKRGYFQFYEGKLWVMILELNPDKVDHFSIYTSLVNKYGEPALIDPKEARWEDKATRMALERPLTLRYMDMAIYGKLKEGAGAKESGQELDRQGFLGGL
jgi:hypothetical protein